MSKVQIKGNASGTGIFTIAAPNTNTDYSITLPTSSATLATTSSPTFTGDVTFDTSTLVVDATNNKIGIGTTSPSQDLHIFKQNAFLRIQNSDNNYALDLKSNGTVGEIAYSSDFKLKPGGVDSVMLKSNGNVGIGTTSPSYKLHVNNTASDAVYINVNSSGSNDQNAIRLAVDDVLKAQLGVAIDAGRIGNSSAANDFVLKSYGDIHLVNGNGVTNLFVDNTNNRVGIGMNSPNNVLSVKYGAHQLDINTGSTGVTLESIDRSATSDQSDMSYYARYGDHKFFTGGYTESMRIDNSGRLNIGTTANSSYGIFNARSSATHDTHLGYGTNYDNYFTAGSSGKQVFRTASTERMIIDSNGYVTMPYQLHIFGTPHTGTEASSGDASVFRVKTSRGLSFSNSKITVPVAGVYMITWQTIAQTNTGRYDTQVKINGTNITNGLNEDNGSGYHQRTHSFTMYLSANDYIQFNHSRWYSTGSSFDAWNTASVTLLG